jgi:ribonuclease HI
MINRVI